MVCDILSALSEASKWVLCLRESCFAFIADTVPLFKCSELELNCAVSTKGNCSATETMRQIARL